MDKEILEKYIKAGRIAAKVRDECKSLVKPGKNILDIVEEIERRIIELGGEPAFPVNIGINNIAAHYTPEKGEDILLREGDIVKIDIGVHIDGYIGDTAITISLGGYEDLLESSRKALNEAIKLLKPGIKTNEIAETIQKTIESFGFKVISNLTGHGLERFNVHAEPQIPNVITSNNYTLKEYDVIAIEPFATTGIGFVKDLDEARIFSVLMDKRNMLRSVEAREIYSFGIKRNGLPFTSRWLELSKIKFRLGIKELKMKDMIYPYYILAEKEGAMVAQFEHTIIIRDKPIVTTIYND
ncbi:MAG: type II methionyl aminopeptidase [Candidatus Aenigmatarchaeota archaeon]